jgi:3-oxoacyl-[acyl-carrier protein] reductase
MKRALVTGGTGGIGAAICAQLGEAGHHVFVHTHRQPGRAAEVAASITTAGGSAECPIRRDRRRCKRDCDREMLTHGPIQILVNNAGCLPMRHWRAWRTQWSAPSMSCSMDFST